MSTLKANRFENTATTDGGIDIDATGDVGVGLTSPASRLHVKGGSLTVEHGSPVSGSGRFNINVENNSQTTMSFDDGNALVIGDASEPSTQSNFAERFRIDSSGNVGIGMSTLNQTSSGRTVLGLNGSSSSLLNFNHGNTLSAFIYCDSGEARLEAEGSRYVNFRTGGVERMRIGSAGETTFRPDSNGLGVRSIAGSSSVNAALFVAHSSSSMTTGSITLELYTNGDIKNSNNSYGSLSDERLKENIVAASSQWEDIKALRIRNFNFRENTGHQTHKQIGLIAQEVEKVCPGLVQEKPVKEGDLVFDKLGNKLDSTKTVASSVLYMKAVKALQEAIEKIEILEAKVAALESA